jgi:hypothetical protein
MPCSDDAAYSNTFDAYLHGMEICSGLGFRVSGLGLVPPWHGDLQRQGEKKSSLYIKKLLYLFLYSNTFDAYLHGMEICKNFPKKKNSPV